MRLTFAIGGLGFIVIGSFVAAMSDVFPTYRRSLRDGGGSLLIGGITLLGCALPLL
jgi:hypothetical protein